MRLAPFASGTLLVVGLAACAGGAPNTAAGPVGPPPESPTLAWFANAWGPFVAAGDEVGGIGTTAPLFIVDGEQVFPSRQRQRVILDHMVEGPGFEGSPGEFRTVRIFRHRCDKWLFGQAGGGGVVMAFTPDWTGPVPASDAGHPLEVSREHPPGETCHSDLQLEFGS